jgi:hypothetical protein
LLGGPQRLGLDAAGADPPDLFSAHDTARFQDLEVLEHGGK